MRARDDDFNLKQSSITLDTSKGVVNVTSLEVFKVRLDRALGNLT